MFGPAPGNLFKMEQDSWGVEEKLSEEDNNILEQPFLVGEVKTTLLSIKSNRAPGMDNIPVEFYQVCVGTLLLMILWLSLGPSMRGPWSCKD